MVTRECFGREKTVSIRNVLAVYFKFLILFSVLQFCLKKCRSGFWNVDGKTCVECVEKDGVFESNM